MAKRRKLLAGLGALASGSAAAVGTGAFTSVEADRSVNVAVADDANAYLGLDDIDESANSEYVDVSGEEVVLNLDSTNSGGSGFNANAETRIDDLIRVTNQGTQTVNVWVTLSGGSTFDDDTLYFYPGDATDTALNDGEGDSDGDDVLALTPGESASLGVLVDLGDVSSGSETPTATFRADVQEGPDGGSEQVDDSGGSFATVSNDGTGDFDTQEGDVEGQTVTDNPLQTAINNASGSTIVLKNTDEPIDIPEPLTVPAGKDGLELRGLDRKPTIRYIGGQADGQQGINILAPDVTFDNLDFEIYPGRDGIGRNKPFTGGTSGITLRNTGLTVRNTDITLETEDEVSFDSASVRLFQVSDTEDKGDGTITIENSSFASNSGADGLVRTSQFFQTGGFLNQSTPFTDGSGDVVDRSVTITGCTFGDGSGTQAHSGEGQSVEITGCTFTGSGNINGYPEGDVTISGNDFTDADHSGSEFVNFDIQFASVPDVVNGTDVEEGRTKGANAAARTFGRNNTNVSVRVQRDEFDDEGNRVTVAGPATFPSGSS